MNKTNINKTNMNKTQFLAELEQHLSQLQKQERERFITYYEEMIADYMETGMNEAAAVQKLGHPRDIARELLAEADTVTLPFPRLNNKFLTVVLLIVCFPLWGTLLAAAVLTLICVYLAMLCLPFATGLSAIAFLIASLVSIIFSPWIFFDRFAVGLTQVGLGIVALGLSALSAYLTVALNKKIIPAIKNFNNYLYRTVKGVKL